jgi:hypothetical protein
MLSSSFLRSQSVILFVVLATKLCFGFDIGLSSQSFGLRQQQCYQSRSAFSFIVQKKGQQPVSSLCLAKENSNAVNNYRSSSDASRFIDDNKVIEVTMKFGGSSLANAERVDYVANLIKGQIAAGYRPRAVICSAMGKTTNSLLSAGEFALGTFTD